MTTYTINTFPDESDLQDSIRTANDLEVASDSSGQIFSSSTSTEFIGTNSPAVGNVNPTTIDLNLLLTDIANQTVSLTVPLQGAIAPNVDVFLLFDDTGSFE